jgi:phosphopantothenoylcysteine decarboxylase/phosphopantothenate--cysteine ligase
MKTLRILVTAGPTREPIDPVRFISNYSTGAMGYAIAKAARDRRHKTTLITGPTSLKIPERIKVVSVISAKDMFAAVKNYSKDADCVIMAAAVSDFCPAAYNKRKLKRTAALTNLRLKQNPDILQWLGRRKNNGILAGFCMETDNLILNAKKKMAAKNLDIMVANKVGDDKSAFGAGKTSVVIIGPEKTEARLNSVVKEKVASILLDKIEQLWYKRYPHEIQ